MFSASSEARDRNAPTNDSQTRLQTSRIRQEHPPIRYQLPARLSFRQGQASRAAQFSSRRTRVGDFANSTAPASLKRLGKNLNLPKRRYYSAFPASRNRYAVW